nr:hypothetical protein [Burkholderia ambifaria]
MKTYSQVTPLVLAQFRAVSATAAPDLVSEIYDVNLKSGEDMMCVARDAGVRRQDERDCIFRRRARVLRVVLNAFSGSGSMSSRDDPRWADDRAPARFVLARDRR